MTQLKETLKRLKNPAVIISILSQIITILLLLKVNVDADLVTGITTAFCSILVLLGILSNPDTVKNSYSDDIFYCKKCKEETKHSLIADEMLCSKCGNKYEQEK